MTEARLSSLALMSMHRDICVDLKLQDVAKEFIKDHPRCLYQPNLLQDNAQGPPYQGVPSAPILA